VPEHFSKFHEKISQFDSPTVTDSICCWTDLLGFGSALYGASWEPSDLLWKSIFDRITEAHRDCYRTLDLATEFVLTLNDGIVRCCNLVNIDHIDRLSMWFRQCILTHNRINEREQRLRLPGARTVMAHGKKLIHGPSSLTFEDFVINDTKRDPNGPSSFPRNVAERVVASNPEPLQLNLAFSKAYILERLGKESGIEGGHFYVDQSVLGAVMRFSQTTKPHLPTPIDRKEEGSHLFAIPRKHGKSFHLGFRFQLPSISVNKPEIVTTVFRAAEFYPSDEPLPFTLPVV
jgi:hypothetical protein